MTAKTLLTYILIFGIFIFLIFNVATNYDSITAYEWRISFWSILTVSVFLLPIYLINASSWHFVNLALGSNLEYKKNLKIWLYSNLGRILPGVIWQYTGRLYLSSSVGVPKSLTITALIIEAIFNLSAGVIIVFSILLFTNFTLYNNTLLIVTLFLCVLLPCIFLLNNHQFMSRIMVIFSKLFKVKNIEVKYLSIKWIPILLSSYTLQFIFGGSVLFFLCRMIVDLPISAYPVFIGIFASSWLLGYISIFSPSGLGVQEISLAGLLSIYMPFSIGVLVAITFRVLLVISELITITFLQLFKLRVLFNQ